MKTETEKVWENIFVEVIDELKRETKSNNSQEYRNGVSAALLIFYSAVRKMEEKAK